MIAERFDVRRVIFLVGIEQAIEPLLANFSVTGAAAMIGTRLSTAEDIALPRAPDELSTSQIAGEAFSSSSTAPSPANAGSVRAILRISAMASSMRSIAAREPRQPKAPRRNRALKVQV